MDRADSLVYTALARQKCSLWELFKAGISGGVCARDAVYVSLFIRGCSSICKNIITNLLRARVLVHLLFYTSICNKLLLAQLQSESVKNTESLGGTALGVV